MAVISRELAPDADVAVDLISVPLASQATLSQASPAAASIASEDDLAAAPGSKMKPGGCVMSAGELKKGSSEEAQLAAEDTAGALAAAAVTAAAAAVGPEATGCSSGSRASSFINSDISSTRWEYFIRPPAWLDRFITAQLNDPRDAPLAYVIFNVMLLVLPAAISLFLLPRVTHWHGIAYLVLCIGCFLQRFILCLHNTEHLQPFKSTTAGWLMSLLCPNVLCILYGLPPGIYRLHHIVMHHCENNLFPYDASSTEPYQRDSFLQFLGYWCRFWCCIAIELPFYALRRRRFRLFFEAMLSLTIYFSLAAFLYSVSPVATLWVIIIPFFITSFALMFGNWSQHIFVHPSRPRNNFALTYNVVNTADNQRSFNDGYHILHHSNSKLHWLDLPSRFMATLHRHAEEDAFIFEGIGFFEVGLFVFTGQLHALAKCYVNIGQPQRSEEELVQEMRERLKPIQLGKGKHE